MRRWVVAGCVLLLSVTSCSTDQAKTPNAQAPQAALPSPASRPEAHLGQTLNLMRIGGQQIAVTLTEVIAPATVPSGWGQADKNYVATKLRIENTGSTTIVGNTNSDVSVVGSDAQKYEADFATVTECQGFSYGWFLIAAGASNTGCVVFALPSGVTAATVRYAPSSGISHDVGEWRNP